MDISSKYKFKKKSFLFFAIISLSVVAACFLFGIFLVKITMRHDFIDAYCFKSKNEFKAVLVFSEWNSGEDGIWHEGYLVKYVNLSTKSSIDEIKIKRYYDNKIPEYPSLKAVSKNDFWLLAKPEFIQGDTGFFSHLLIKNEKINLVPHTNLIGFIPQGYVDSSLLFKNKFNESYCYNTFKNVLVPGQCISKAQMLDTNTTAFIRVKNTRGSLRYKIFFYQTDKPDPMNIQTGFDNKQTVLYYLWFSGNEMEPDVFTNYNNNLKPNEKIIPIEFNELLVAPKEIFRSKYYSVMVENNHEKKQSRYFCFANTGKLLWKIDDRKLDLFLAKDIEISTKFFDNTLVLVSKNWILGIDFLSGKETFFYLL